MLELGQRVTFTKIATIEYRDMSEDKTLQFEDWCGSGVVCGVRYKCEGRRIPASIEWGEIGESYDTLAEFKVSRRHRFYLVHETLTSKPILVHPDHISTK